MPRQIEQPIPTSCSIICSSSSSCSSREGSLWNRRSSSAQPEMGDTVPGVSTDPPATTDTSSAAKSVETKMVDSMSTGWTDEKHSLYLNSMETSFVNQLYRNEHLSRDFLGWLSRTRKHTSSSGSNAHSLLPREFKVQRQGCWEKVKFERAKRRVDIENQSRLLSANPWIQHFRSPNFGNETEITSSNKDKDPNTASSYQVDDNVFANQSTPLASPRHGREATNSKQHCSHLCCHDSLGSNIEVSDQNFVDKEFERGEQSSRSCCQRRTRTSTADSPFKDQVVPSRNLLLEPSSYGSQSRLRQNVAECSIRMPTGIPVFESAAADNQQQA